MKKLLSIFIAVMLVFSLCTTVFAATGNPTGSQNVTGTGDTEYIDLEIYTVTLPTIATLDFTLDPQGLLALENDGDAADLADLKGGAIIPAGAAPKAINNSAVDIALTVNIKGTGDATFIAYDTDEATTIAKVDADTNNNVLLYAAPSSVNIVNATTEYSASNKGYIITDTASDLKFVLKAAEYKVANSSGTYVASPKPDTGSGTGILLGGYVNSKANWSDYANTTPTKTVGVTAVFSYAKASDAESADAGISGIPGLLSTTAVDSLQLTPPTPGFNGVGAINLTNGGTLTVAKGTNVNGTLDFNFAGGAVNTNYVYIGTSKQSPALVADYFVFDPIANKVGIKNMWATASTNTVTFKLAGSDTIYTFTLVLQ
jgi:hypothetical protein